MFKGWLSPWAQLLWKLSFYLVLPSTAKSISKVISTIAGELSSTNVSPKLYLARKKISGLTFSDFDIDSHFIAYRSFAIKNPPKMLSDTVVWQRCQFVSYLLSLSTESCHFSFTICVMLKHKTQTNIFVVTFFPLLWMSKGKARKTSW